MRVLRLTLRDFRCYQQAEVALGESVTVITGPNGAGKTNLLEALYFGCTGRSCRTNNERELVRFGASATRVVVQVEAIVVGLKPLGLAFDLRLLGLVVADLLFVAGDGAIDEALRLGRGRRRELHLQPQRIQRRLGDVELRALRLIVGPRVDGAGLRLLHPLADVAVLDVADGDERRRDGGADGDDRVEGEATAAARLSRALDGLVHRVRELSHQPPCAARVVMLRELSSARAVGVNARRGAS